MSSEKQLSQWLKLAKSEAIANKIDPTEVEWLLKELTDLDSLSLRLNNLASIPIQFKIPLSEIQQLWQLRITQKIPLQYLIGQCHWRNFTLTVSPNVLIPRPETELMIDLADIAVKNSPNPHFNAGHWLDLGTGSGAIAIGLTSLFPDALIHAVDLSEQALAIAKLNAQNLNLSQKINFYQGFWFNPLAFLKNQISGIVCNPPYIPTTLIQELQLEVQKHEPHLALDGGNDGLRDIRFVCQKAPKYLIKDGILLLEIMKDQALLVVKILEEEKSYHGIQTYQDYNGIERFILAYKH